MLASRIISPQEYDEAAQRRPHCCPLWLMGDRRSGQQLIDSAAEDYEQTMVQFIWEHVQVATQEPRAWWRRTKRGRSHAYGFGTLLTYPEGEAPSSRTQHVVPNGWGACSA